jgi:uncharacterized metal-binding protein
MPDHDTIPLIYACSGCSNVAQLANSAAVELNKLELAEMSCISGVGGGVKSLVRKAQSGRDIIAIDGCPLACVKHCLGRHNIEATHYYELTQIGLKKQYNSHCDNAELQNLIEHIKTDIPL